MPYVRQGGKRRYTLQGAPLTGGSQLNLNYGVAPGYKPPRPYVPPAISAPTVPGGQGSLYNPQPIYREPNWGALIAGDPEYTGAESEINMLNQMERGSLRDQIRRAVIQSGLDVGADEDIDAATLAAARANQFSGAADIANQLRRGSAQSDAQLAARGALSSGAFTENRGVLQRAADLARNTLQSNLLGSVASGRQAYASTVAERQGQLRNLRASIAARLASNPGLFIGGYTGGGGGGLAPAPAPAPGGPISAASLPYAGQYTGGPIAAVPSQPAPTGGGANPANIVRYEWRNGVQYAVMRDGRRLPASSFGGRF